MEDKKIKWLKRPIPMNIRYYSKYGNIFIDNAECIEKSNLSETIVLNQPKENFHLHMGFRKSVITDQSKKGTGEEHIVLMRESFERLKGVKIEDE